MASKDKLNSKKRYQEAVKCTFNLIGLPPKPKGAGIKILCIDGGGTRQVTLHNSVPKNYHT